MSLLRPMVFFLFAFTVTVRFAAAGIEVNGSFEIPADPPSAGSFITIAPGEEGAKGLTGWLVGSGDIDIVDLSAPLLGITWGGGFDGDQVLDLNGNVGGSVYQDLTTVAGTTYSLTFWYANNPLSPGGESARITVFDVGTTNNSLLAQSISHSSSTGAAPDWSFASYLFTADGTTSRLTFSSTSNPNEPSGGIVLDAVNVIESDGTVPEPASVACWVGMGLALVGMKFVRRRRNS